MNKRNSRDLFPGTGAGKGDADRSPNWRDHYNEIDWQRKPVHTFDVAPDLWSDGFRKVGANRLRKVYR